MRKLLERLGKCFVTCHGRSPQPAECERAGLARALVLEPRILLADESGSGLGRIAASEIDELLLRQKTDHRRTLIIVRTMCEAPGASEIAWRSREYYSEFTNPAGLANGAKIQAVAWMLRVRVEERVLSSLRLWE